MEKILFIPSSTDEKPSQIFKRRNTKMSDEDYAEKLLSAGKSLAIGGMYLEPSRGTLNPISPVITLVTLNDAHWFGWTLKKNNAHSYFEYFDNSRGDIDKKTPFLPSITSFFVEEIHPECCNMDVAAAILQSIGNYILTQME